MRRRRMDGPRYSYQKHVAANYGARIGWPIVAQGGELYIHLASRIRALSSNLAMVFSFHTQHWPNASLVCIGHLRQEVTCHLIWSNCPTREVARRPKFVSSGNYPTFFEHCSRLMAFGSDPLCFQSITDRVRDGPSSTCNY